MTSSAASVLYSGLPSVLGACPPTPCMLARRSSSTFTASSRGYDHPLLTPSTSACRSSSTFAASSRDYGCPSPPSSTSACRSSSTFVASSCGYDRLSLTPSTSAPRSSSTLAASSRGNGRVSLTPSTSARHSTSTLVASSRVLSTLSTSAHRSTPTWRSTLTPLVASVCVDGPSLSARDCTSPSSTMILSVHEIVQLRCLLDAWDSSPIGSASSVTDFFGTERPPSPSLGISPWLLDTGASFHMTHDSSLLNSV
jgi:hypothetical protein